MQRTAPPSRAVTILDSMPHPSHELFELVQQIDAFPNGVTSIPKQLQGSSFFTAGVGLLVDKCSTQLPKFPVGGIMILAHDWGTVRDFELYEKEDEERLTNPTWRNMLPFFERVGIRTRDCFFTNFFVGLRTDKSSVGVFPGAKDPVYVMTCQRLLAKQIDRQRPRLVLVLGAYVPKLIASMSDDLKPWERFDSFKAIDRQSLASFRNVNLRGSDHEFSVASLVHPCYRQRNARNRRWKNFEGDAAEVNLVKELLAYMGSPQ